MAIETQITYSVDAQTASLVVVIDGNPAPETAFNYASGRITAAARPSPIVQPIREYEKTIRSLYRFGRLIVRELAPPNPLHLQQALTTQSNATLGLTKHLRKIDRAPSATPAVEARIVVGTGAMKIEHDFSYDTGAGTFTVQPRPAMDVTFNEFSLWVLAMRDVVWACLGEQLNWD